MSETMTPPAEAPRELIRLLKEDANLDAIYEGFADRVGPAAANALVTMSVALDNAIIRINELTAEVEALKQEPRHADR